MWRWSKLRTEYSNYYYHLEEKNVLDLIYFVSVVTGACPRLVTQYAQEIENDLVLRNAMSTFRDSNHELRDSELAIGRRLGWYLFTRVNKPKVVVETGIHHGLGGLVLIRALEMNSREGNHGTYIGTDINPNSGYLIKDKLGTNHKILIGDSIQSLRNLVTPIDLFINDSDHSSDYEYQEYETIFSLLTETAQILGDNSHVSDSLRKFSEEKNRKYLFFKEVPKNHWYPGAGIGVSFKSPTNPVNS